MDCSFSKNHAKKLNRKVKKSQHIVEKQTCIPCTSNATKYLVICNAGLVNGLSQETIYKAFIKHGPLEKIVMLPGKSCAFVEFKTVESATSAFENIHGKLNLAQDNKPLFLSFCETVPDNSTFLNENPPGLIVMENFVTKEEEESLLLNVKFDEEECNSSTLKHRSVKHFGYEFRYDINNVDKKKPLPEKIPAEFSFLWKRLQHHYNLCIPEPDQLTVNYYKPGQGIPPHVDTHSAFEGPFFSLSLGSDVIMDFRHEDGRHIPVLLPQRSLAVLSGESRYNWTHGIAPRKIDIVSSNSELTVIHRSTRMSFTFRKIRKGECDCTYTNKCDTYTNKQKTNESLHCLAAELEKMHVQNVYENIADHFSITRHKPWPNVLDFINCFGKGSILIDVGCGNGKYLGHNENIFELGCDSSTSLIDVCKERGFQAFTCNCLNIPLKDGVADGVISIAVIHHLASEERRLQAIKEIIRILKIGGRALIYIWAKDQNKNHKKSTYLKQDRKNRRGSLPEEQSSENIQIQNLLLPIHRNRTQFQHQDVLVPWKLKGEKDEESDNKTFLRFYHVFQEGELDALCVNANNINIIKSYYDEGNWCIIFEKIKS